MFGFILSICLIWKRFIRCSSSVVFMVWFLKLDAFTGLGFGLFAKAAKPLKPLQSYGLLVKLIEQCVAYSSFIRLLLCKYFLSVCDLSIHTLMTEPKCFTLIKFSFLMNHAFSDTSKYL